MKLTLPRIELTCFEADARLLCDEDGKHIGVDPRFASFVAILLGVPVGDVAWEIPDVFSMPYGSPHVGWARSPDGAREVEFVLAD